MERKLASIQKVLEISPIKDADKIELAKVLGWQCVVKKSENFKVGELAIYFEIDSMLDENNPSFDFLKKDGKIKKLKTVSLKKTLSQGLLLPLTILNNTGRVFPSNGNYFWSNATEEGSNDESIQLVEGLNLTSILNIKKYEEVIPVHLTGLIKGNFPSFCRKTDEPRIQGFPEVLDEIKGIEMIGTLKCDGCSVSYYLNDKVYPTSEGTFGVCSRNLDLLETEGNLYWQMARKLNIEWAVRAFSKVMGEMGQFDNLAVQAEIVGPGIQGNKMGLSEVKVLFFNIWDIEHQCYVNRSLLKYFCDITNQEIVPVVFNGIIPDNMLNVNSMLEFASKLNYDNGSPAEGIVWRPKEEKYSEILKGRLSFKCISNRFLLSLKD